MRYWPSRKSVETDARNKTDTNEPKEEPRQKPKDVPPPAINPSRSQADVEALLVSPSNLSMATKNTSTELAWDLKYEAIFWNLDEERNNTQGTVLSLPQFAETFKGDFLKPGAGFLPRTFLDEAKKSGRVKKGDRLFGFAVVTCSNCSRNRSYWIYYIYETSGWYSPLPLGQSPALEVLSKNIPAISQSPEYFFRDVPASDRKPILDFHSESAKRSDTESDKNSSTIHHDPRPPSAIVQQFSAPYGNLANRCKELGQAIVNAADARAKIMPTLPAPVTEAQKAEYYNWYMQNDGIVFHSNFWNATVKLQKDLKAVNITDTRLDELLERHAWNFARRNQEVELATKYPTMYHCSIEVIRETGERLLYLATQVPK